MTNAETLPEWTFGDRLAKSLDYANMSTDDMAEILGVSERSVRNYVAQKTTIKRGALSSWALATGVPREWIEMGDKRDLPPSDERELPTGRPAALKLAA